MTTSESSSNFESGIDQGSVARPRRFLRKMLAVLTVSSASGLAPIPSPSASADGEPLPPPLTRTDIIDQVPPEHYAFINITTLSKDAKDSYSVVYTTEAGRGETSNTNVQGVGKIATNSAFVYSGATGRFSIDSFGDLDELVDVNFVMPRSQFVELFPVAPRVVDTRSRSEPFHPGEVLRIPLGVQNAGNAAIINLTVDRGTSYFVAYACEDGPGGTSTVNAKGTKAGFTVVPIDRNGDICVTGPEGADGIIVDWQGTIKSPDGTPLFNTKPERIIDTRTTGDRLLRDTERVISLGSENAGKFFVGRITTDRTKNAGYIQVGPTSAGRPNTSLFNPNGVDPESGEVIVLLDENGQFSIWLGDSESTDLMVDKRGTLEPEVFGVDPATIQDPTRLLDTRNQPDQKRGVSLMNHNNMDYIRPDQVVVDCYYRDYNPAYVRYISMKLTGLTAGDVVKFEARDPNGVFLTGGEVTIDQTGTLTVESGKNVGSLENATHIVANLKFYKATEATKGLPDSQKAFSEYSINLDSCAVKS